MGPFDAQIKMEGANMGGHMFSDGMLAYMLPPGMMEDKLYLITMNWVVQTQVLKDLVICISTGFPKHRGKSEP